MFDIKVFIIIFIIFILFCGIQIYFYYKTYIKKEIKIRDIESFENTLVDINNNKEYILDDVSLERILTDYENLSK